MPDMHGSLSLSQRMELRLQMTTAMIQSIELLQLPLLALEERVQQELEENPALEVEEEPGPDAEVAGEAPEDRDDTAERAFQEELSDLEEEWNDSLGSSYRPRGDGDDPKYEAMQNAPAPGPSLHDYLDQQLTMAEAPERLKEMARLIIYSLDDHGFLQGPLEEVFRPPEQPAGPAEPAEPPEPPVAPPPTEEEIRKALELVQSLDPPGVGARDLRECLLIQLRRSPGDTSFEVRLVEEHLQDLLLNRLPKIAKDMEAKLERVKEAVEVIAAMNPHPGALFGGAASHYIRPDVVVELSGDDYEVRLNDNVLPRLRVSPAYLEMGRASRDDQQVREYVREKVRSARWLIEAIGQRRRTLLKIVREVVRLQRAFLDHGVSHLRPLPMHEVADNLGLHASTVSRAMTGKYAQTPQGVYPLRFFITGGYQKSDGEGESSQAVMERIREMVGKESPDAPLTDQQIVAALRAEGLAVARRTVAKYRERLGIAGSRQRKKY